MLKCIETIDRLRELSGNAQLDYLEQNKSDLLKEILLYTYDPHKVYKINEVKYNKTSTYVLSGYVGLDEEKWNEFKTKLDQLVEIKTAKDDQVRDIKAFIESSTDSEFLKMVLFKDLRLNMSVKSFQKIWFDFCKEPQVQLAHKWNGEHFEDGLYSRKLDGLRTYVMDGIAYSRSNKKHSQEPIRHILDQLKIIEDVNDVVLDGELIYLNEDGSEDFQKAVSLARSENRTEECNNLYYVVFDVIPKFSFLKGECLMQFDVCHALAKQAFKIDSDPVDSGWYKTCLNNVFLINQVDETGYTKLSDLCNERGWEGLMYRDANAPYMCKRTKSLLKIKNMQDVELKLLKMEEGTGKYKGKLGAFIVDYKGYELNVGSGFSDAQRTEYWNNKDKYIGKFVKVQYFEETQNQQGEKSLRFPVFLCFRDINTSEEFV